MGDAHPSWALHHGGPSITPVRSASPPIATHLQQHQLQPQQQHHVAPSPSQVGMHGGEREPGSLKDAIAQVAYMRRVMGQLEVGKSMLERELHNTITSRDLLSNELDSLSTLCQQLEQANDVKTREKAELEQEVALLNNMVQNAQAASQDEIERLRVQLDDAIREGSMYATELQNSQAQQQTTNQLVQEIKGSHDRVRELENIEAHLTAQVKEMQSIDETQRNQIQELQGAEAHLTAQLQELQHSNAQLAGQLQEAQFSNEQLTQQANELQHNAHALQSQLQEMQINHDRLVGEGNVTNSEKSHLHHTVQVLQSELDESNRARMEHGALLGQLMDAAATTMQQVVPKSHPCPTRAEVQHCVNLMTTHALKFDEIRKENNRLQLEVDRSLQDLNRAREELKQVKANAQMKDKAREEEVNALKRRQSLEVERMQLEQERGAQERRLKDMEMARHDEANRLLRDQLQQLTAEKERDLNNMRMESDRELHRVGMESTEKLNSMLKDVNSDRLGWEEERAQARQKYEALQRGVQDEQAAMQQKQKQLNDHVQKLEAQLMRTSSDLEIAQQEAQTIAAERDVIRMEADSLREQIVALHNEQGGVQQSVMLAEAAREREAAAAQQAREEAGRLEAELSAVRQHLNAANESSGRDADDVRHLRTELLGLQSEVASLQQKLAFAEQRASMAEAAQQRDSAALEAKDEAIRRLEQERKRLEDEVAALNEHIQMLQTDLQQQQQQQQSPPSPELEHIHNSRVSPQRARPTPAEHGARQQLATAPIGSAVIIEENVGTVPQSLVGTKGIVIAHAVSPAGEPGCLVGV
eukprot:TRINITY_DN2852_c0_g1_i1.p1 TRINITY_DN2852_c0_g1~~TRINITY_DN2852_c0_g1_i1.p1  ORF type:complete len:815 (+),score=377.21 TRINITY_DN2852_c0_g1_i1:58-2502(+)